MGFISSARARTKLEGAMARPFVAASVALALLMVAAGAFLIYQTRGTTLWFDEWIWAMDRRRNDLGAFLEPHNSHLSLVPILLYRVLFASVGLDNYVPYRLMVIGAHLGCATLVFVYASRRVGALLALAGATLVLFLGPASQNIIWPFQVAWLISLGAGVIALLMLDRRDRFGDVAASALLALSIASSGIGLPIALGMAVDVLWGRRRWRDAWIVAVPLALYGLWWLGYQDSTWIKAAKAYGITDPVVSGILHAPQFVADSAASSVAALVGLGGSAGVNADQPGTFVTWGAPLAIAAGVVFVWRTARLRSVSPRVLALLTIPVSFWAFTAVTRGFISSPFTSRYLYVGGLFIVLTAVELARGVSLSRRAAVALIAVVAAIVVSNLGSFREGARYLRVQADVTRAQVGALDITRAIVRPDFTPNSFFGIEAGPYFAAEKVIGTPAATPAELVKDPENVRSALDRVLIRIQEAALRETPPGARLGTLAKVDATVGGSASERDGCFTFRPAAFALGSGTRELHVTVPPTGLVIRPAGGAAAVALRRFADHYDALGTVADGHSATLRLRADFAPQVWHVRITPTARATVCALG
jgi:hypothetical protein